MVLLREQCITTNEDDDDDDLAFDGRSIFRHIIYPSYYLMYGSTDNELQALDSINFIFTQ